MSTAGETRMTINCSIRQIDIADENGVTQRGVGLSCDKCQLYTEMPGESQASVRKLLDALRSECKLSERNTYVCPELQLI